MNDEKFLRSIANENPSALQKIRNAIDDVLRRIRNFLSSGHLYDDNMRDSLLNEIGIYKETRDMMTRLYHEAKANAANQAIAEWGEQASERFALVGRDEDGIEIYETSLATLSLSLKDRKKKAVDLMKNQYKGRTAKFYINGIPEYARFDGDDVKKLFYGDDHSSNLGKKAKIRLGAEGDFFELVEHARWAKPSEKDQGKKSRAHKDVTSWNYFHKEVAVDGRYYNVFIHVRRTPGGDYVYDVSLRENEKKKAKSPHKAMGTYRHSLSLKSEAISSSDNSISSPNDIVNERFSLGYHAGDLGKSTVDDYAHQGGSRGSGHFGFGTYFVGNPDQLKNYNTRNGQAAPMETADFDKYNLFKPRDFEQGYKLHNALRTIDGLITDYSEFIKYKDSILHEDLWNDELYKTAHVNTDIERLALLDNDGNFKPQGDVQMRFPTSESAFGSMEDLIKQGLSEDTTLEAKRSEEISGIVDEIEGMMQEGTLTEQSATSEKLAQRFSLSEPVERSRDLIAVHNIRPDELRKAFKLGGFPMPSIAVTKDRMGHDMYGDISLMFHSDTIDPKANRNNRVYGGDAYTPEFPDVVNKYDHKVANRVEQKIEDLLGMSLSEARQMGIPSVPAFDDGNLDNKLRYKSDAAEAYYDNEAMRIAYLRDTGRDVEIPMTQGNRMGKEPAFFAAVADAIPDDIDLWDFDVVDELRDDVVQAMKDYTKSTFEQGLDPRRKAMRLKMMEDLYDRKGSDILAYAYQYKEEGGFPERVDALALTGETNQVNFERQEYEKWLNNLFDGIIEKQGIRNNKDTFTPNYNRRSWESLHDPVTLDNIVKAMKGQLPQGYGGIRGAAQKSYKNLDEIRADEDRLQTIPEEQYDSYVNETMHDFQEAIRDILDTHDIPGDNWDFERSLVDILNETRDKKRIQRMISDTYNTQVSDEQMDALIDVLSDMASIPTGYFEAKPRRAVGFDEVQAAIIPQNLDEDIKAGLSERGISTYEYDSEVDGDRTRAVNEAATDQNLRFSIVDEDEAKSQIAYDDAMDNSYELLAYYEQQIGRVDPETFDVTRAFKEEDVVRFLDALKSEDAVPSNDAVFEEDRVRRARSKEDFFNNVNAKWNDRWTTECEVLKISSVKRDITNLVKGAMANSDSDAQYRNEIVRKTLLDARTAYQLMKQDRTELASYLLYHSAQRMIDGLEFIRDDTAFKEYKEIRDFLRGYRINAPEEYWQNVEFNDFRKEYYGRLRIGKGNNNIESVYQDLADRWPYLFNESEREKAGLGDSVEDLLQHIGVVVDSNVTPFMEAYSSEEATSLAYDLADQLYEIIANGDRVVSLADSYKERFDAQTKAMKQRHYEAILRERKIREEGIQKERRKFREYKERQKEKTLHTKNFESIKKKYDELTKRLLTNTKDKHIPEQYKRDLAGLLKVFDFQTVGSKKREERTGYKAKNTIKLGAMRVALERIEANSQLFHINDSITDIMQDLLGLDDSVANKESIEGKTLDELTASELKKVDNLLAALLHEFNNYEKVRVGVKKQQAADIGHAQNNISLEHAEMFGAGKDYQNTPGWVDKILNLDEMTAAYLFKRIDPNKEGLGLMYGEIRKSFDKYVRNQNQLNDWMEEIVGKYHNKGILWNKYGSGELTNWRSDNYAKDFKLENGHTIRLTIAQIMSVACLANREQAYNHMVGNGVVVAPVTFNAKILSDLKKKVNKALPERLTDADIIATNF